MSVVRSNLANILLEALSETEFKTSKEVSEETGLPVHVVAGNLAQLIPEYVERRFKDTRYNRISLWRRIK